MGSMRNANHSLQLPIMRPTTINGTNVIVLPTNLKLLSTPRKTLPSFSASKNDALIEDWFQESEKVAILFEWNDVFKLQELTKKLRGDALTYHQKNLASVKDYSTWRNFMIEQFTQNDRNFYLRQLEHVKRKPNQSVRTFAQEIDSLLVKTLGLAVVTDRSLKTFCFHVKLAYLIGGLHEDVRKEIGSFPFKNRGRLPPWSFVVEEIQDIEWLVNLRKNKSTRNNSQLCDHVKVYVAISGNLKTSATGYGVFFGENDPKNVSQSGYHTCNASLIIAAITSIQQAKKHGIERLAIHTSSEYLLKFLDEWAIPWLENSWRRSNGKPVKNLNRWRELLTAQEELDVKWVETNKTENGYKRAIDLAFNGLRRYVPRAPFNVPRNSKTCATIIKLDDCAVLHLAFSRDIQS